MHCCSKFALSWSKIEHYQHKKVLLCLNASMSGRRPTSAFSQSSQQQLQQTLVQPDVPDNPASRNDVIEIINKISDAGQEGDAGR
jgi:hypothetical protein